VKKRDCSDATYNHADKFLHRRLSPLVGRIISLLRIESLSKYG
jgi:hypothetical protein